MAFLPMVQCYAVWPAVPCSVNKRLEPITGCVLHLRPMQNAWQWAAWGALLLVVAVGAPLDVMQVDAAQYARMSLHMLDHAYRPADATWLELYDRGEAYLDKPPLLFWVSASSFKLFGVHNWSYKLPSILFAFLGVYATFRFARLYYSEEVARTAALMFGASAAFVLMTNDVRTDTILTASVITAIWLGAAWLEQRRTWQLVAAACAIAAAMMAKGPMGLMAPLLALGSQVLLTRRLNVLLDVRWMLLPLLVALLLLPMCMGLYQQHGMHGLRFYFWEQSFGRLTGENFWKDDSTFLFFTHELPWQVLPWTVFVLAGVVIALRDLLRRVPLPEYASLFGALLVFLALSRSQFKLPHYLYVVLPLFAVLGARAWHELQGVHALRGIHLAVVFLLWAIAMGIVTWSFPQGGLPYAVLLVVSALVVFWAVRRWSMPAMVQPVTVGVFLVVAFVLNGHFYPHLLRYQAPAMAGQWAAREGLGPEQFYGMRLGGTALDFYAGYPVPWLSDAQEAARIMRPGVVIYTDEEGLQELKREGMQPREHFPLSDYPVQLLSIDMLEPAQRPTALSQHYLLRF